MQSADFGITSLTTTCNKLKGRADALVIGPIYAQNKSRLRPLACSDYTTPLSFFESHISFRSKPAGAYAPRRASLARQTEDDGSYKE